MPYFSLLFYLTFEIYIVLYIVEEHMNNNQKPDPEKTQEQVRKIPHPSDYWVHPLRGEWSDLTVTQKRLVKSQEGARYRNRI